MSAVIATIEGLLVRRLIRVLILGLLLAPLALGVATQLFTEQNTSGEYVLLSANIVVDNTTSALYRIVYNTASGKLELQHEYDLNATPMILQLSNVDLQPGDVATWHGWDWYHDGDGDYVVFDIADYEEGGAGFKGTIVAYVKPEWNLDPNIYDGYNFHGVATENNHASYVFLGLSSRSDGSMGALWYSRNWPVEAFTVSGGAWHLLASKTEVIDANNTNWYLYYDGAEQSGTKTVATNDFGATATVTIHELGNSNVYRGNYYKGKIAYAVYYIGRLLSAGEITSIGDTHVIDTGSLKEIYDATWFNGTHYLGLISNTVGTPYGNVARLPAEQTWLWLVKGLANDGLLHLKWFPENTTVRFRDPATGSVLYEFNITGVANAAGLIEDYVVNIPAGNYTVEAVIEYEAGATIAGLPPYAIVRIDNTEIKAPESGVVTIPPGNHTIEIVAKTVTEKVVDLPFSFDPDTDRLDINLGKAGAVWLYAVYNGELTLWDTRTTDGIASFWGRGTVIYPVAIVYDWDGNAEVLRNSYFIILPETQFKLSDYGTVVTINTTLTAKRVEARSNELIIDNVRISNDKANVTILSLLNDRIKLVAEAPGGTVSYTTIRGVERPQRVLIQHPDGSATEIKNFFTGDLSYLYAWNGEAAFYDPSQRLLVIKTIHHSPATILVEGTASTLMQTADTAHTLTWALMEMIKIAVPAFVAIVVVSMLFKSLRGATA